jgi:hypothetical protein
VLLTGGFALKRDAAESHHFKETSNPNEEVTPLTREKRVKGHNNQVSATPFARDFAKQASTLQTEVAFFSLYRRD